MSPGSIGACSAGPGTSGEGKRRRGRTREHGRRHGGKQGGRWQLGQPRVGNGRWQEKGKDLSSGTNRLQRQVGGAVCCTGVTVTTAGVGRERHLSGGKQAEHRQKETLKESNGWCSSPCSSAAPTSARFGSEGAPTLQTAGCPLSSLWLCRFVHGSCTGSKQDT